MNYPRELNLSDTVKDKLTQFLRDELTKHYAERGRWYDNLMYWQRTYWAEPDTSQGDNPFNGSKLIVPLIAIAAETIHARDMNIAFGLKEIVVSKAQSPDWEDASVPFEQYVNKELVRGAKIYDVMDNLNLERVKFGNCIAKAGYEKIVKKAVKTIGEQEQEFDVVTREGATVEAVPLSRFIMPFASVDPEKSVWCGEQHSETPYVISLFERSGLLKPGTYAALESYVTIAPTQATDRQFERNQEDLEGRTLIWPDRIDWTEHWMSFDVDEDGKDEEIVVHYHFDANLLMSCRYNWYSDLRRGYRIGKFFPVEHRWTAIGVCKQLEQFQEEITTQHRQQLDNATIANMRMFAVNRLSGYGPGEPIFAGKLWILDDTDYIKDIQLGDIYPSAYNSESSTIIYAQQRSGINEITLGQPEVGTPGTATSDLTRVQEGNKKQGYEYRHFSNFFSELITDFACNIQQFGPRYIEWFDVAPGGQLAKQVLTLPDKFIRDGIIIELKNSGQQDNKLLDRQNWVDIGNMFKMYGDNRLAMAMQTGDPNVIGMVWQELFRGSQEIMKQILESYDIRNIDRILMLMPNGSQQSGGQLGGAPNSQGIISAPGMAGIPAST